jgi:hypothetical protein
VDGRAIGMASTSQFIWVAGLTAAPLRAGVKKTPTEALRINSMIENPR